MPKESRSTPEAAVDGLSRALVTRRWRDAVTFLDKTSVNEFHRSQVEFISERHAQHRVITADDLMRHDPDMPREVAEYTVRQHRRHQEDRLTHPDREFAGINSWAEIPTLAPEDLVSRWLEAQDPANEVRRQLARTGRPSLPDDFLPPLRQLLPLGHVRESDRLAHVVCRERHGGPPFEAPDDHPSASDSDPALGGMRVVTARRDDRGDWYVVFDYVLLSGGSISWMYDEPSPGDSAPGKDREPDTAAN